MEKDDNVKDKQPASNNKLPDKSPAGESSTLQEDNNEAAALTEEELENEKKVHQAETERD